MKENVETRREARQLMSGGWFGRVFAAGAVLYLIVALVGVLIAALYRDMSLQTWSDFLAVKLRHMQQGLGYAVPSSGVFWRMTGATAFQQFLMYVFGAIFVFGMSCLMLKAVKNDSKEWFASSFGGFSRPLEVTWLLVLMNLRVFLWSLLFVVPGIVAVYRYRQAWYLKSEHPDWGAGKCLAESGGMMRGHKWQAFCLDVYYVVLMLFLYMAMAAVLGVAVALRGAGLLPGVVVAAASMVVIGLFLYVIIAVCIRFFAARAVFYRALPVPAADVAEGPSA